MKVEREHNYVTVVSINQDEMTEMIKQFLNSQGYDVDMLLGTSSSLLSGEDQQITFLRKSIK